MFDPQFVQTLVHHFPENGVKLMLQHPDTVHEVLRLSTLTEPNFPALNLFDFPHLTVCPETYIHSDFRHTFSDLLVQIPFHPKPGKTKRMNVYLLLEHKSQPTQWVVPQVWGYVHQIYARQAATWLKDHNNLRGFRYQPVIPLVLYTGEKSWRELKPMLELVEHGELFREYVPSGVPLFLSLPSQTPKQLEREGGAFGQVLQVLQQRSAALADFRHTLERVVRGLETRLGQDQPRLLQLLSYLVAAVYHYRIGPERPGLRAVIEQSIVQQTLQAEVQTMGQTIAQELEAKGKREGKREGALEAKRDTLLMLLRQKFGKRAVTPVEAPIEATTDLRLLNAWLKNLLNADTVAEVGIEPTE